MKKVALIKGVSSVIVKEFADTANMGNTDLFKNAFSARKVAGEG